MRTEGEEEQNEVVGPWLKRIWRSEDEGKGGG